MIKLTVYCDEPDCDVFQEVFFADGKETFDDFIKHIKSNGWTVSGGPDQKSFELKCMCKHDGEL